MTQALSIAIPVVSFFLMALVGLSLTPRDVSAAFTKRRALAAGIVLPWVITPILGWAAASVLPLSPDVKLGFLLLAACPVGGIANIYALLARANSGLSVTLTSVSCLASWGLTPLLLGLLSRGSAELTAAALPFRAVALQVGLLLVLPTALGLAVARRFGGAVDRHRGLLGIAGGLGLALLLFLAVASSPRNFTTGLAREAAPTLLFTLAAFAAGEGLGRLLSLAPAERFVFMIQAPIRNLAVAMVLSASILGKTEYAAFAAAFFFLQTPLLLGAVWLHRRCAGSSPADR